MCLLQTDLLEAWGFKPSLAEAGKWLAEYKKTGKEPAIPQQGVEAKDPT